VQRALDRWTAAQERAIRSARAGEGAVLAVRRAAAAWRNYWELHCEAETLGCADLEWGECDRPATVATP
jgi:hypothetical protein